MSQSINRTQLNESLSALVDDEASELELRRVLAEVQKDDDLRERWHRYQAARAAMQGEDVVLTNTMFADRIRDAVSHIEMDRPVDGPEKARPSAADSSGSRWKANAGRVAIAASVAAAVLLGSQQLQQGGMPGAPDDFAQQTPAADPAPASAPSGVNIPTINVQNVSGGDAVMQRSRLPQSIQYSPNIQQQQLQDDQVRRYIRQLMLEHAEHSAQNSGSGLLPYARVPAEDER
ncbi:sigma-E factor negative regulatory protein [Gilvimarinus sp. F26214L]|uniref:sigma-E factor negative regulatory protein n=1 Tax=Gilvimarinus sp. DZF01 TaxID=3461371 RepID=UPI0040465D1B